MGPYYIPRNVNDEGRILFIFTGKSMITTTVGAVIGVLLYTLFKALGWTVVGIIAIALFAFIGYTIGTFKIPETNAFEITRKTGGQNIDDVIIRGIKFRMKKGRIYVYDKEETKDE